MVLLCILYIIVGNIINNRLKIVDLNYILWNENQKFTLQKIFLGQVYAVCIKLFGNKFQKTPYFSFNHALFWGQKRLVLCNVNKKGAPGNLTNGYFDFIIAKVAKDYKWVTGSLSAVDLLRSKAMKKEIL